METIPVGMSDPRSGKAIHALTELNDIWDAELKVQNNRLQAISQGKCINRILTKLGTAPGLQDTQVTYVISVHPSGGSSEACWSTAAAETDFIVLLEHAELFLPSGPNLLEAKHGSLVKAAPVGQQGWTQWLAGGKTWLQFGLTHC
eukprot:537553-Pelagomonas_calceolata.AAC.4